MSIDGKIQALIIPLRSMNLIVPQVLVVEIIPVPHIVEVGDLPWASGIFDWRDQKIPLISIERFCNPEVESLSAHRSRRVAVLNGLGHTSGVTQYGIEISSIPHPVRLGEDDMVVMPTGKPCEVVAQQVQAVGVKGIVPDFPALEKRVAESLKRWRESGQKSPSSA